MCEWACEKCDGKGFTEVEVGPKGQKVAIPCECREREILRRMIAAAEIPETLVQKLGPGPGYELTLVDDLVASEGNGDKKRSVDVVPFVHSLISGLPSHVAAHHSIVFKGDNGTGKTLVSLKLLIEALRLRFTGRYITSRQLVSLIFRQNKDTAAVEQIDCIRDCDFLVYDEFLKEGIQEGVLGVVEEILRHRLNDHGMTIIITNRLRQENEDLEKLGRTDQERLHLRTIQSYLEPVPQVKFLLLGKDYRLRGQDDWFGQALKGGK